MKKEKNTAAKKPLFKRILKGIGILILAVLIFFAGLIAFLSVTEYKPAEREAITPADPYGVTKTLQEGATITVVTWNTGYGALGDNADFFMDGGSMVKSAT